MEKQCKNHNFCPSILFLSLLPTMLLMNNRRNELQSMVLGKCNFKKIRRKSELLLRKAELPSAGFWSPLLSIKRKALYYKTLEICNLGSVRQKSCYS